MQFDLFEAGMELKKQFGNDARLELICEDFGYSVRIKLLHKGELLSNQFTVTHMEITDANVPLMNLKFAESIYELQKATT